MNSIPFPEYRVHPGINAHYLIDLIQRSPAHARWNKDHDEDTPTLQFGRAFHAAILEPTELLDRFDVLPEDLDRRTKAGKDEYARLESSGKTLLKHSDMHRITAMNAAVRAHKPARELLGACEHVESSIFWQQGEHECKARLDGVGGGAVIDLKTCQDASQRAFERSIWQYGYHIQAAWYMAAARAAGQLVERYCLIAVESVAPYGVAVYQLHDDYISAAERQIEDALAIHAKCRKENKWPGYAEKVLDVLPPAWLIESEEWA